MITKQCSHGKTWVEDCLECEEAVSLRGVIASFEPMVTESKARLKEIEREISKVVAVPPRV